MASQFTALDHTPNGQADARLHGSVQGSPTSVNPFSSAAAYEHSAYSTQIDGRLMRLSDAVPASQEAYFADLTLRAAILHPDFPCVGAKSAVRRDALRTAHYPLLGDRSVTAGLARDLFTFATELRASAHPFATFIATFAGSPAHSEQIFERELWQQLQLLHEYDARFHRWDSTVQADPQHPDFAYSFAEMAFFVVGMHPLSGRWSRRLPFTALAFNPRFQFDRLRTNGGFGRMQRVIRRADAELQGTINPMLDESVSISEARQYAGRAVEADWRCPFAPAVY